MLTMLIYPLRKRIPGLRWIGAVPFWFRLHMLFGILGPALIVLHSNFRLGSLNSRVALFVMLTVAGSGYVGRFLYVRINRGLGGQRYRSQALKDRAVAAWSQIALESGGSEEIKHRFDAYHARHTEPSGTVLGSFARAMTGPFSRWLFRRAMLRDWKRSIRSHPDAETMRARQADFLGAIESYLRAVSRAEFFAFYERLFFLWHMLHLPLFVILVFAALLHVFAVHLY